MEDHNTNVDTQGEIGDGDFNPDKSGGDQATQSDAVIRVEKRSCDVGQRIDRYVLQKKLGEGGFGQVWLAEDTRLARKVAIKLPHRRLRPETREAKRFTREAETAAKLAHPNLVPIIDAVLHEERAYIVSEYCDGPTLLQWNRDRDDLPSPKLAISIVAQLASGLKSAHDQGLIHRDIKPSNIILTLADTDAPVPRLTDFGLARAMSDTSETRMGTLIGSGPYMSPEQASGNTMEHGPHSDVHGLGVLLYELLTGHSPFASDNEIDTIQRIICQDPPSIRRLRPELSRDISAVCQKCLEKNPKRRYRDAGELEADLVNVLNGRPSSARPVGRFGRVQRWASRNKALSATAVFAMASLLTAIVGLTAYAFALERSARQNAAQTLEILNTLTISESRRREADVQRNEALTQRNFAEENRLKLRHTSYTSDVSSAYLRFNQGRYGQARRLLDRQFPESGEEDLRTFEWWLLDTKIRECYEVWGRHEIGGSEIHFLDDETGLVTSGDDGNLLFWNTETGQETNRLEGLDDRINALAVLPENKLLVSGSDMIWFGRNLSVIDRFTGRTLDAFHSHPTTIESIRVSSDANVIASAARYESIRCWLADEKRTVDIKTGLRNSSFALSPDGNRIATGHHGEDVLRLYDTHSGKQVDQTDTVDSVARACSAHENPWVAFTCYNGNGFGIANINDLNRKVWQETASPSGALAFSSNDRFLGVADDRAGLQLFERVEKELKGTSTDLPTYQSVAKVAGDGGVIENLIVSRGGDIYTIGYSGNIERFSPMQEVRQESNCEVLEGHFFKRTLDPKSRFYLNNKGHLFKLPPDSPIKNAVNESGFGNEHEHQPTAPVRVFRSAGPLRTFGVSKDGSRLAAVDKEERLHVYDLANVRAGAQNETTERLIDLPECKLTFENYGAIEFSSSGRFLACTRDWKTIVVYDLDRREDDPIVYRQYENGQSCLAFSPTEDAIVCAGYGGLEMIDIKSAKTRFMARKRTAVRCVGFHPDLGSMLVGTADGLITSLDPGSGSEQFTLHGTNSSGEQAGQLAKFKFYGDGRVAIATQYGEIQFWDLAQRLQLGAVRVCDTHGDRLECVDFTIDLKQRELFVGFKRRDAIRNFRWSTHFDSPTFSTEEVTSSDVVAK